MSNDTHVTLSRRERQIMDIVYKLGTATAADVHERLPADVTYSTVRAKLRVLEEKGQLRHEEQGPRYVFIPIVARDKARKSALHHLMETFFDGSTEQVVAALLDGSANKFSQSELDRLSGLIEEARRKGEGK